VEGMGGISLGPLRPPGQLGDATLEAVVAWNTPKPYHPATVAFINRSLDHWAGGAGAWHNRFTHHDKHHIERELANALGGTLLVLMNSERIMKVISSQADGWSHDKALQTAAIAKAHELKGH